MCVCVHVSVSVCVCVPMISPCLATMRYYTVNNFTPTNTHGKGLDYIYIYAYIYVGMCQPSCPSAPCEYSRQPWEPRQLHPLCKDNYVFRGIVITKKVGTIFFSDFCRDFLCPVLLLSDFLPVHQYKFCILHIVTLWMIAG